MSSSKPKYYKKKLVVYPVHSGLANNLISIKLVFIFFYIPFLQTISLFGSLDCFEISLLHFGKLILISL